MGKHTLRFGVDARRERYNALMYFAPSDDYGNFTFSGSLTNYSFGDFLLGLPNPSYFAVTGPQMDAQHRAMGRIRSGHMAGEQPSHGQFRVTVGIASAV